MGPSGCQLIPDLYPELFLIFLYPVYLNAESQRITRRDKKAFLSEQCKEIEENYRMTKTRELFKKIRDTKRTFHANQFSSSVMSDSLRPHGLQQAGLPCPSQTPRAYSNSCPLSGWCHPTIAPSVIPLSSCLQSFSVLGSFPMCHLITSGDQSIRASASAAVLPVNIQDCFSLGCSKNF